MYSVEVTTMNEARLSYLARKMAPRRTVAAVREHRSSPLVISGKTVELDCGHKRDASLHHAHTVGDKWDCPDCGRALALLTPEFSDPPTITPELHADWCERVVWSRLNEGLTCP